MKRVGIVLLLVVLLVGMVPLSAQAVPPADLAALARYLPFDTAAYIGLRTDAAFIREIDDIVAGANARADKRVFETSLTDGLDSLVQILLSNETASFQERVRPWLGDMAAYVGVYGLGMPVAIMSITDREGAEAFATASHEAIFPRRAEVTEGDGYTLVSVPDDASLTAYMIFDDVMMIAPLEILPLEGWPENTLSDNPAFAAALDMLPETDYDAVAYVNLPAIFAEELPKIKMAAGRGAEQLDLTPFLDATGSLALGFTIFEGRALAMDVAQLVNDAEALAAMGVVAPPAFPPVDLAFAARIPAGTPLVVQATALGPTVQAALDSLHGFSAFLEDEGISFFDLGSQAGEAGDLLRTISLGDLATFVELTFKGVLGLKLEDVLTWMTGDFAAYLAADLSESGIALDHAWVIETVDADAAQALVDAIAMFFEQNAFDYTMETIGGVEAIVLPGFVDPTVHGAWSRPLHSGRAPIFAPQDLVIAANDTVIAIGMRDAVTFSLAPIGGGLADDPTFVAAQAHLLEHTEMLWYVGVEPAASFLEETSAHPLVALGVTEHDVALLRVFESATISGVMTDNGDTIARFVLTLSE